MRLQKAPRTTTRPRRDQSERREQAAVLKLLGAIGARFWVAGTVRKKGDHPGTQQTPGLADIPLCFLPSREGKRQLVVIEVKSQTAHKAKNGGLRPEQHDLMIYCMAADVPYIHGPLDTVIAWLIEHGYLKANSVASYRVKETR